MMHIRLLPLEVLLDIFAIIHEEGRHSLATIAVLARTCRRFKEPALDTLWKNMDGFKPLILCLPERVRGRTLKEGTSQSQLTLKRPLFAEEWKIFNYYACRVRSLTIYHWNIDEIDSRVTGVFVSALSPILLPNLRSLYWWDGRDVNLSLLRTLLASTIRSMTLGINPGVPWKPSFKKSTLLVSLGARCPHIQEFVCPYDSNSDKHLDAMWEVVCCWSKLIHLRAGVLNTRALAHLASLPSLKYLHFISYGFVDRRPKSIPTFTSEIDEVSITASSLPILTRCLRNVHFISCRSVKLHISISGLPRNHLDMSDLVLSLSECFSPALEQLAVEFAELKFPLSTVESIDIGFVLSFHAIVPLLPFSRLTVVDLGWFCASVIDDVMVKKMAQSWPQLEEFYLGNGACWLIPPSLTFIGLVHLIRYCHHLREIAMLFHASLIDSNSEPFSKTIPNEKITNIFVGNSPIDVPISVACQLHTLLPNLCKVVRFPEQDPPLPSESEWARVEEFLVVLIESAKMKKKHTPEYCKRARCWPERLCSLD